MKQYGVIITPAAENDLLEIFKYITNELSEPQTATNLCDNIQQQILKLSTMPDRHTLYKKEPWLSRGLRFFSAGNFLVFYITRKSDCTVHVLRVMYGARSSCNIWRTRFRRSVII
ncbi:MAG: type II toxin-antitoxin system RelE/ParE family toxin [Bacillota bacterium]|nr:type II toxin-antitoxin system RelE/ParE family toxin [Bacillota bacterium]